MENIKNIVFDFGGVIVDISRKNAVKRFVEIGLENADELLDAYKQTGIFLALEEGKLSAKEFYDELRKLAGKNISNEHIDYAWLGFFLPVVQERLDFLLELKKKYKIFLLSNTNPIVMSWACSSHFSHAGKPLNEYFDKLYLSYKMGIVKPYPEIFRKVLEDAKINASETLFVDDGAANIKTASELGFKTFQPQEGEDYRSFFMSSDF